MAVAAVALLASSNPQAQSIAGPLGVRQIKAVWMEGASVIVITPETPFDASNGCAKSDSAVILQSNPTHKLMLAAALSALNSGKPIAAWAQGCFSGWGTTQPIIYAFGTGAF